MDHYKNTIMQDNYAKISLLKIFEKYTFIDVTCHKLKTLLLKKYISTKLHFWSKKISAESQVKSSKTVSGIMQK
jgi:hypothetical protein